MVRPTHLEDPEQSLQAVLPSTSASERLLVSRSDCARTTPVRLEAVLIRRGWFVFRSDNWAFDSPRRDATAIIDSSSTTPNADHRAIVAAIVGWSRGNDLCRCSSSPSVGRRPCPVSSPCPCPVSLQQHAMNLCQSLLLLHCHSHSWPIRLQSLQSRHSELHGRTPFGMGSFGDHRRCPSRRVHPSSSRWSRAPCLSQPASQPQNN